MVAPAETHAQSAPLVGNAVIIDNAPFFNSGGDGLGSGNYALNHPSFIDIPYAIFDFGTTSSVSSAMLTWNFRSLFGGSGPAQIALYVGNDADGSISIADRFMGTLANVFTYSGGELRTYDVTSYVNSSLGSGRYFAARLEATVPPASLSGYYGGQFDVPSLNYAVTATPEPASVLLLGTGLVGVFSVSRRRRKQASAV